MRVLWLFGWLLLASPAFGQQPNERARAVRLVTESRDHYEAGRFDRALELLTEARKIDDNPVIDYNMARAHEGLGNLDLALNAYQSYIRRDPDAPDRGAVEKRIDSLKQQIAERERLAEERDSAARRAAEARRQAERERRARLERERQSRESAPRPKPSPWPWVVASTGGVALATGGVLALLSSSKHSQAEDERFAADAIATNDDAKSLARVANICFVGGAVLGVAGLTWAWFDAPSDKPGTTVAIDASGIRITGRFR